MSTAASALAATRSDAALRPPSLENQPPAEWRRHAEIAYAFARHARHDLANIHCALGMLEMVETMQAAGDGGPLPPELEPEYLKAKIRIDVKQLVATSNDLVLLSQAASRSAYAAVHPLSLRQAIEEGITNRYADFTAAFENVWAQAGDAPLVMFGDTLPAALSAFFFQWSPALHGNDRASRVTVTRRSDRVTLAFPADDTESVASFARRLKSRDADPLADMMENTLSITTTELALHLARFVVGVHGGHVTADPNDPDLALRVTLPVGRE